MKEKVNIYTINNSALNLTDYIENQIWILSNNTIYTDIDNDRNPYEDSQNKIIVVQLDMSRKPLYYMINWVLPCIVLNIISILSFMFPYAQQIALSMSLFLTYGIYGLRVGSDLPIQSDYLPTISVYYIASLLFAVLEMFWFYFFNRMLTSNSIPIFLKKLVTILKKCSENPPR